MASLFKPNIFDVKSQHYLKWTETLQAVDRKA